eukprot:2970440-Ditylum_brightwellii.AAC.1
MELLLCRHKAGLLTRSSLVTCLDCSLSCLIKFDEDQRYVLMMNAKSRKWKPAILKLLYNRRHN